MMRTRRGRSVAKSPVRSSARKESHRSGSADWLWRTKFVLWRIVCGLGMAASQLLPLMIRRVSLGLATMPADLRCSTHVPTTLGGHGQVINSAAGNTELLVDGFEPCL